MFAPQLPPLKIIFKRYAQLTKEELSQPKPRHVPESVRGHDLVPTPGSGLVSQPINRQVVKRATRERA